MEKLKNLLLLAVLAAFSLGLGAANFLLPDQALSRGERRSLQQRPAYSTKALLEGRLSAEWERYLLDQFPARDRFRTLKAAVDLGLLRHKDSNGIFLLDGGIYKLEYPLNEAELALGLDKIRAVQVRYLQGMQVYFAVVPDKTGYVAAQHGYPAIDEVALLARLAEALTDMDYIDLFDCLTADDYYRTDSHWRQERLFPVAERIAAAMGCSDRLPGAETYTAHTLTPFHGVYLGQSALPVAPDTLTYLTSAVTDGAVVKSAELAGALPVYAPEKLSGMDGYDVFLHGAQALLTIENPAAETDRALILFRDSYGSSLTPLLIGAYAKITVVDLRYISSELLGEFIDFQPERQDVLFLYGVTLLNHGSLLK